MGPLIPLALSLATKFIPELVGKALDSDTAVKVTDEVIKVAQKVTGHDNYDDAMSEFEAVAKPEHFAEIRSDILKLVEMQVKDVQHARENNEHKALTENVAYGIMYGNLILIAVLIGLFAWVASSDLAVSAASTLSAIIGGALNQLYQERQQVAGYLFGSSLGSKLKDLVKRSH